jgi:hypothetical protein
VQPRMSASESGLLRCAAEGKHYGVEFGTGGSTFLLIDAGVERMFSVESDPHWIEKVVGDHHLRPHLASGRLTIYHGNIGPTGAWGHPTDRSTSQQWPNYWREPWRLIDVEDVDFLLVDGRFRVACTLTGILHCSRDLTIVIHDFWDRQRQYGVLLKYLTCACRTDTLAVLFPKVNIDLFSLNEDLLQYANTTA